ncbi:MAG: hypothetical protein K2W33_16450, partial [Burkholderiales bacterium]|nr:hypothetical protein [Burkholderiales bacterium]
MLTQTIARAHDTTASEKAELQTKVLQALKAHLPSHALLYQLEDTVPYECDGLTAYRERPLVVALPETEAQVAAVIAAGIIHSVLEM